MSSRRSTTTSWCARASSASAARTPSAGAITEVEAAESDVADERVMAVFKGRLAVNVDTMCAFGDRVSETAAAEIEFGLLGYVREDVRRNPTTDRHALIAARDPEVRARIEPRARDLYREVESFWRDVHRARRAGRRRGRAPAVAGGVGPLPRGGDRDDARHHVRRRGVRRAPDRLSGRRPARAARASTAGTATPTTTRCRRRCGRSPTATSRWRSSSTNTATRATGPPTSTPPCGGRTRACCGRCSTQWRRCRNRTVPRRPAARGVQDRVDAERELLDALRGADA